MPLIWWLPVALAHQPGLSYARIEPTAMELRFSERDLAAMGPEPVTQTAEDLLREAVLSVDGVACRLGTASATRVEGEGVEVRASLSCPSGGTVTFDAAYLPRFGEDHRLFVESETAPVATLDREHPTVGLEVRSAVAGRFVPLGIEHILTGWDHLAFVAALVLGAASRREVLALATAFTVAHSITLGLAVTGALRLSPTVVEPLIAASIVWVAVENLRPPPFWRRVGLTFLFGLVHGLGFAGVLAELGLPAASLLWGLFTFNVGVELGQIAAIGVLLLGLAAADRMVRAPTRAWGSLALSAAGMCWFVARVAGA
jgi:hydrogenase/urease accessory protein HupE